MRGERNLTPKHYYRKRCSCIGRASFQLCSHLVEDQKGQSQPADIKNDASSFTSEKVLIWINL